MLTRTRLASLPFRRSANNVNAILAAREKAVSLWLSWALDTAHDHRPGAPINAQYVALAPRPRARARPRLPSPCDRVTV